MQCPQCQTPNRDGAHYCRRCGAKLASRDASNEPVAAQDIYFCDVCGGQPAPLAISHSVKDNPAAADAARHPSTASLDKERKQVTVLFADISSSTKLIAGRDPEDAGRLLEPILKVMMDSVHLYGGTVNQVRGDEIMALFGAPFYLEDHALRACYAALRMHENVTRIPASHSDPNQSIMLHVGISTGEVLVGSFASDVDRGYSATGEVIHLGARLQQMAKPGATLCAGATIKHAEGFVETIALGHTVIRGLIEPVEIFELVRAKSRKIRFQATADRGLSPFLGRHREWEILRQRLGMVEGGHGQVVALVGDAGVGKSRLTWEFTHSALTGGWQLLEGGGMSYALDIPYFPIVALLKGYFDIEDRDDKAAITSKVNDGLSAIGEQETDARSAILSLFGLDVADADWANMDPLRRRELTNSAFVRLLHRESAHRPLIIVIEDLHWVDNETRVLLDHVMRTIHAARLLLLVNYRPEYQCDWIADPSLTSVPVSPLSLETAQQLAATLFGNNESVLALRGELVDRTKGNPFFLEECVRTLAESHVLEGELGAFRLARGSVRPQVPASVRAVVGARIDRLTPDDKRVVQAASAIGPQFPLALLGRIVHEPSQTAVQSCLHRLRDSGLVYESSLFPELVYSFTHTLTQEVAYESLPQEWRRRLHGDIAREIEEIYQERISEYVETLAYHAFLGEVWDKAVKYARHAGQKAAARSAYREAVAHFERSLTAMERLPRSDEVMTESIDTRFELRNAFFPLGKIDQDLEHLRRAEQIAGELGDDHRMAWVSAFIGRDLSLLGSPNRAIEAGERALALAAKVKDNDLCVVTSAYIGQVHYALGDYKRSAQILKEQVHAISTAGMHRNLGLPGPASVFFRAWLVWALARLGEFERGTRVTEDLVHASVASQQPLGMTVAQYSRGFLLLHRAEYEGAVRLLEGALELCSKWDFTAWFTNIASSLGYAYAFTGRVDRGIELLEQAVERTRAIGILVSHALEVTWLGEACLAAGRHEPAEVHARTAIELARKHNERGNEAEALRLRGEIALRREPYDSREAIGYLRDALSLGSDCGMRPTASRCHLDLALAYRKAGERRKADDHLSKAGSLLDELGMTHWLRVVEQLRGTPSAYSRD